MKERTIRSFFRRLLPVSSVILCAAGGMLNVRAADFFVQSPDVYTFNGGPDRDPVITLVRGVTYTFQIATSSIHPFQIVPGTGVVNNNISSGILTFTVPANAVNGTTIYKCSIHGFGNSIQFVDPPAPPPPPTVKIVALSVGTNLVLTSTGTNTWTTIPEFSTNLMTTNWYALTVQTNRFSNGTNETICGRPPGNAVFLRIRAQSP